MHAADTPPDIYADDGVVGRAPPRDWRRALRRGFAQRCPQCGEGRVFYRYLKSCDACETCGEELHHHRADDAPPYMTIMIAGHVLGALMLASHRYGVNLDVWTEAVLWPAIGLAVSLWMLPRVKGALIAYQWALRMHGFEGATATRDGVDRS